MRKDHLLSIYLLIPFVLFVLAIPFAKRIYPIICGMPFLVFWLIMSIILSSICVLFGYYVDYGTVSKHGGDGARQ